MNRSPAAKPKNHKTLKIFSVLMLIVLVACVGLYAYKQHQKNQAIAKQKSQYIAAEQEVNIQMKELAASLGTPGSKSLDKSCGHASREFGTGDLYCSVGQEQVYPVVSVAAAKALVSNAVHTFATADIFRMSGDLNINAEDSSATPAELLRLALSGQSKLTCSAVFTYYSNEDRLHGYSDYPEVPSYGVQIGLSCGSRPALAAYYPIKDD